MTSSNSSGGMPSPTRPIAVTFDTSDSDWFVPVEGEQGRTFLPQSIPSGSSATAEGSIKILIRERRKIELPLTGEVFTQQAELKIKATMPWLNRDLPCFEVRRKINIQYPCQLQDLQTLATMGQGSRSIVKFDVSKGETRVGWLLND